MHFFRLTALACTFALGVSACGVSSVDPDESAVAEQESAGSGSTDSDLSAGDAIPIVINNEGGSFEGHTPRGFEGFGTGLFTGDELNSTFPTDDATQIWLSFELPDNTSTVAEATLQSSFLSVRGNPFETLGDLHAAPVRYDEFGPSVVSLEPVGAETVCPTPADNNFICEVTDAVNEEIEAGRNRVQIRLRFERVSDPDGEQDMAFFFKSDSNTNEPGIFELALR